MRVKKAVIPAAGFETRMLPITKAQPKEMVLVIQKLLYSMYLSSSPDV